MYAVVSEQVPTNRHVTGDPAICMMDRAPVFLTTVYEIMALLVLNNLLKYGEKIFTIFNRLVVENEVMPFLILAKRCVMPNEYAK